LQRCRQDAIFRSQLSPENVKLEAATVLHRGATPSKAAVREAPDFKGLFRYQKMVAERVGFEPTVRFPAHTLSKRAP
jgi:hypothetical protein